MTNNEMVRDVCAEAKSVSTNWIRTMNVLGVMPTRECIFRWCDRILAAYEREIKGWSECADALEVEIGKKYAEIVRLKAALMTICTADKTAEELREIAIAACNGKESAQ